MHSMAGWEMLLKTPRGLERIAASRALELLGEGVKATPAPGGALGLVMLEGGGDAKEARRRLEEELMEAEKILPVEARVPASLEEIGRAAAEVAFKHLRPGETFAVRTTRRGSHPFTSIDVNVRAGACIQQATGNPVDLDYPDKIVWVEIVGGEAFISVTEGGVERKKTYPGKPDVRGMLAKIVVAQVPYTGDLKGARKVGVRIGRAAQTFELRELVIAPFKPVDAAELAEFIGGVLEGAKSRYEIQLRAYGRRVRRVKVVVQDLYQFIRDRRGEPIIATSTRGRAVTELVDEIGRVFEEHERVNVLIGAREGLPTGLFRYVTMIVDVAPGVTLATDVAISSCITALLEAALAATGGRGG